MEGEGVGGFGLNTTPLRTSKRTVLSYFKWENALKN